MILVKYLLNNYFRSRTATSVLIKLNAGTAVQVFFSGISFCFFHYLILRKIFLVQINPVVILDIPNLT